MRQITRCAVAGTLASLSLAAAPPTFARAQPDAGLAADIQELKQGQAEIKAQLEEIRKLLTPPPPPSQVQKVDGVASVGSIPLRGRDDAAVTLIEFSDYQCPYCKRQAEQTMPELLKEYVDTGKVRYAFRDFPLVAMHPMAQKAAEAARCAGEQGKYWEMHDKLFASQPELQAEKLPGYAGAIGLDEAKVRECLDKGRYAEAVKKDLEDGGRLGVRGTPMVVLGRTDGDQAKDAVMIRGAFPAAMFKAEIDKLLGAPEKK